jgi:tetratricopeptide (TPR) repeat protein
MRFTAVVVLFLAGLYAHAQTGIVPAATQLIVNKQYDAANAYLDSILKKDKKNVDALMMKGNVILNRELAKQPDIALYGNAEEDYYSNSAGTIQENVKVIPPGVAKEVAAIWEKCLKIDKARFDIRKGLCSVYAMALMKEELKQQLAVMIPVVRTDEEQAYNLAEYARKFKERGRFEDAMDVYVFIAQQFPNLAGIRCDIASEYFFDGQLNLALQWLDSATTKPNMDETTYLNAAFTYSELAYYDNAQKLLDEYSVEFGRNMGQFYRGLRLFAEMDKSYADTLSSFVATSDSTSYYNETTLAKNLLLYRDTFTMNNFRRIVESEVPEYYRVLVYQRAVKQFADSCEAYVRYGAFNNLLKNYSAAVQFLEEGEGCVMDSLLTEYQSMNYGFSLYMLGQYDKALPVLQRVVNSNNTYRNQAANYFTAKILLAYKRPEDAKVYLQKITTSEKQSKYKQLTQQLLSKTNK